jgi:hypothetical protein
MRPIPDRLFPPGGCPTLNGLLARVPIQYSDNKNSSLPRWEPLPCRRRGATAPCPARKNAAAPCFPAESIGSSAWRERLTETGSSRRHRRTTRGTGVRAVTRLSSLRHCRRFSTCRPLSGPTRCRCRSTSRSPCNYRDIHRCRRLSRRRAAQCCSRGPRPVPW